MLTMSRGTGRFLALLLTLPLAAVFGLFLACGGREDEARKVLNPPSGHRSSARREAVTGDWATLNGRGKIHAARGEYHRALNEFDRAIALNPTCAVLYANRGGAKLCLGDHQGAIRDASRAVGLDPKCVEGWINRAQARQKFGDWNGAADDYTKALGVLSPSDPLYGPVTARIEEASRQGRKERY